MFLNNSFGRTLDVLSRSMDASTLRRQVIANNIANAETPNFKRSVVNYESELRRAMEQSARQSNPQARITNERHIPFDIPRDYRDVQPRRVLDYLSNMKENGNNVDLEEEMMNATQNQMLYQLMAQAVGDHINKINLVLR